MHNRVCVCVGGGGGGVGVGGGVTLHFHQLICEAANFSSIQSSSLSGFKGNKTEYTDL